MVLALDQTLISILISLGVFVVLYSLFSIIVFDVVWDLFSATLSPNKRAMKVIIWGPIIYSVLVILFMYVVFNEKRKRYFSETQSLSYYWSMAKNILSVSITSRF